MSDMPEIIWAWDDGIDSKNSMSWAGHQGYLHRNNDVEYIRKDKYDKLEKKFLAAMACIKAIDDRIEYREFTKQDIHKCFDVFNNVLKGIDK